MPDNGSPVYLAVHVAFVLALCKAIKNDAFYHQIIYGTIYSMA